jgi:hypothetical protein
MTIGIETVKAVVPVRGMAAHHGLVVSNEMEMGVGTRVDDAVCPIDLS